MPHEPAAQTDEMPCSNVEELSPQNKRGMTASGTHGAGEIVSGLFRPWATSSHPARPTPAAPPSTAPPRTRPHPSSSSTARLDDQPQPDRRGRPVRAGAEPRHVRLQEADRRLVAHPLLGPV
ncbi:hypothetical protein GCM10009564_51320 [Streptomyces thermogriseus]|uniref:Uncharacterized protein n=1 Tax=Streptomyces thermogriseus TaxID=75292 RepID=A0ABP4DP42_9ACTN